MLYIYGGATSRSADNQHGCGGLTGVRQDLGRTEATIHAPATLPTDASSIRG